MIQKFSLRIDHNELQILSKLKIELLTLHNSKLIVKNILNTRILELEEFFLSPTLTPTRLKFSNSNSDSKTSEKLT